MAGTPEKMLEHLLETRLDNKGEEELGMYRGNTIFTRNKNYILSSDMKWCIQQTVSGFPQALENLENYLKKFHAWKNHGI